MKKLDSLHMVAKPPKLFIISTLYYEESRVTKLPKCLQYHHCSTKNVDFGGKTPKLFYILEQMERDLNRQECIEVLQVLALLLTHLFRFMAIIPQRRLMSSKYLIKVSLSLVTMKCFALKIKILLIMKILITNFLDIVQRIKIQDFYYNPIVF